MRRLPEQVKRPGRLRTPRWTMDAAGEATAEGINLQSCNLVVNYDRPWNPQNAGPTAPSVMRRPQNHSSNHHQRRAVSESIGGVGLRWQRDD